MNCYQFAELDFELRPSGKRKTYGVTVDRDCSHILHVSEDNSEVLIQDSLHDKILWIHTKLAEKSLNCRLKTHESFAYLGRIFGLKIIPTDLEHIKFFNGHFMLKNPTRGLEYYIVMVLKEVLITSSFDNRIYYSAGRKITKTWNDGFRQQMGLLL
ncbi:MAG: hypothetical protein OXC02_03085 [Rhodobacteraceae bacterium]|nr:hypothetical protein [Paracoccaceae bacterium]